MRLFEMFASFVTRNFKTFVEREQAQNVVKLSKISVKIGYFTTLHHPLFAGNTGTPILTLPRGAPLFAQTRKFLLDFKNDRVEIVLKHFSQIMLHSF